MLRRAISQVIRLQALDSSVCSEQTNKIFSLPLTSASSIGSLSSNGATNRGYQTGRLWRESRLDEADGRDLATQVLETSRILSNRKLYSLDWSPHGFSLIPKLAQLSTVTRPLEDQDESDEEDESSDGAMQVSF